jgi:hypothetical protein
VGDSLSRFEKRDLVSQASYVNAPKIVTLTSVGNVEEETDCRALQDMKRNSWQDDFCLVSRNE